MGRIEEFIKNYNSSDFERIKFAWNGKHAEEFIDENSDFREQVAVLVIQGAESVQISLIRDLFLEEAKWTKEAWGNRQFFPRLGEKLLKLGEEKYLDDFLEGFLQSFDTYGSCHGMNLEGLDLEKLIKFLDNKLLTESDEQTKKRMEAGKELFEKYINKTASQGWAYVPPGTPAKNIRVIYPFKARMQFLVARIIRKLFTGL